MCNSGLYGTRFVSVKGTAASFLVLAIGAALVSAYMTVSRACADGEPAYELEEMVVTAGRIPTTFSNITRSVVVIGRDDIRTAPVHSVQDLLQYALGVDVRQRGPLGVQADVAVRGGTFEQTLILVDGTKVSDPQTGHHNLDLPLALEDIERVEILKGQGSRLYGPNAFGGVINIITRKREHKAARLEALAGDYGLREGTVSLSHPLGTSSHHLSLSKRTSGGYRAATDFDISTVSYGFSIPIGPGMSDLSFGYMAKEFGANSFYSDKYPNEWENTNTTFLSAGFYLEEDRFSFSSKFHWRRHGDDFLLDRERPAWYRNRHTTDLSGVDLLFLFPSRLGTTAFGGEAGKEGIESSNLGNHSRTKEGFFVESTPLSPNSPYSASKASADMLVAAFGHSWGLPYNITRCSNNYGPYQFPEKMIPLMINNALNDKALPMYGDGLYVRDWLYVYDHCTAIWKVLTQAEAGTIYNIGGNNEKTNLEVVRLILGRLGKPESLISYVKDRPGHDRRYAIDSSKVMDELGWKPTVTFEEGINKTIDWYLANTDWLNHVVSGKYQQYYEDMYAGR